MPNLTDLEINLLLRLVKDSSFPMEKGYPPALTTHAVAKRAERKLEKMLEHNETEFET
jgi:hypothetical protein